MFSHKNWSQPHKRSEMSPPPLTTDESLVVSKANKGDVVLVLSTTRYLKLAYEHLSDKETYRLLSYDPTEEGKKFIEYLKTC